MRHLLIAAALCVAPPAVRAQALSTDRPDFTESPEVVPVGRTQLEAGATVERAAGETVASAAELLLRHAPLPRLELRLELPDYVVSGGDGALGDAAAGAKVALPGAGAWDLATIGMLTLPVGDSALSAGGIDPSLLVTAGRDLPAGLALGTQAGAEFVSAIDRVDLSATLVLGLDVTERVGAFVEVAGSDLAWDPAFLLHHGYTLALGGDAQIDIHGGVGLSGAAPTWFAGAGFALRR